MRIRAIGVFRLALAASLGVSAVLFFVWTWRWPLLGDSSLIHYIAFLIERGWAPYRQLGDMNLPGSYLIELAAMHIFGMGALGWRLFDFTLLFAVAAGFLVVTRRRQWLAALFAAVLFAVIHGRDGLFQSGQRDLTMAVCLLTATAALVLALRRDSGWFAAAFGLLSGVAATIKPTAVLLFAAELALAVWMLERSRRGRIAAAALLGYLPGPLIVVLFLVREHALGAFLNGLRTVVPYYASLGHKPPGYVLLHSVSPLLPLVAVWLLVLALRPTAIRWDDRERILLVAGGLFGLLNCVLQPRALPYYRYPLLVFLLLLMALDLFRVLDSEPIAWERVARGLAVLGLGFGGLFLAPQSVVLLHRYRWWEMDFANSLQQNLEAMGGAKLSGDILCIDTNSGCGDVLYRMRLEPSSGVLSDFFLFGDAAAPAVREAREQLTHSLADHAPRVIVVTSDLYLGGADADDYRKLARWPDFAGYLKTHYTLVREWIPSRPQHWWSREELPASYRIYVLRAGGGTHP